MRKSDVETHLLQGLEVDFHPAQHKYWIEGTEIQGVTRSAGMTKDTGFLAPWGAKAGAEEADKIFKAKKQMNLNVLNILIESAMHGAKFSNPEPITAT